MFEFGTIVNATLIKNDWHLQCDYRGTPVFVDMLETTWHRRRGQQYLDLAEGDTIPVRLFGFFYNSDTADGKPGCYFGSINDTEAENPYKELARFPPSTVFRAVAEKGELFLPNGASCLIPEEYRDGTWKWGTETDVIVDVLNLGFDDPWPKIALRPPDRFSRKGFIAERHITTNSDFDVVRPNGKKPNFGWMLERGTKVSSQFVKPVESGGLFEFNGTLIFIHHLDSSWLLDDKPIDRMKGGESVSVRIRRYDYTEGRYIGSLNNIEYENPFRELSRFAPDTVFRGKIIRQTKEDHPTKPQGFLVMLPNRSFGFLNASAAYQRDIHVGQEIDVVIYTVFYLQRGYGKVLFDTPESNSRRNFTPGKYVAEDKDFDEVRPPRYKPIFD